MVVVPYWEWRANCLSLNSIHIQFFSSEMFTAFLSQLWVPLEMSTYLEYETVFNLDTNPAKSYKCWLCMWSTKSFGPEIMTEFERESTPYSSSKSCLDGNSTTLERFSILDWYLLLSLPLDIYTIETGLTCISYWNGITFVMCVGLPGLLIHIQTARV